MNKENLLDLIQNLIYQEAKKILEPIEHRGGRPHGQHTSQDIATNAINKIKEADLLGRLDV